MGVHMSLSETWEERGDVGPACHSHLVQRLSVRTLDVLDHHVAVDKVGTDPRWVESGP